MASPMNPLPEKRIIIIAGPNGAGKTTLARELLLNEASTPTFINADLLAAGLNPLQPERAAVRAGRMMLKMIDACVQRGENFAFETTLSGRGYARMIPHWQEQGYYVMLYYLRLPSPEIAMERVRQRVSMGGHHVPDDIIRRRFHASWHNFHNLYRDLVDYSEIREISERPPMIEEQREAYDDDRLSPNAESEGFVWRSSTGKVDPGIEAAMRRATMKARRRAIALTGRVVTIRNGKVEYDTEP